MSRKIVGVTVGTPTNPAAVKEKLKLATEEWVEEGYQPKGEYLTKVPDGYATEKFVTDKIAEAELNTEDWQDGATFTPFVDADGNLSWSNDKGLDNPETVNIKGETPEVRILQAMRSGTSGVKYGVQIEGPKIVDGNGNIISNSGTVWDGADGKPGTAMYTFDPDKALSGDGVIDTSFVNVPTGSYIKQSDLLLAPNGDVYIYEVQANSSGIILKKKATFLFSIAGKPGDDGITPHIGENGNWWIGEEDTGIFAGGQGSGEDVDLTGYATEQWVKDQNYLTEVPEGYAKTEDIPTRPEDIGAQPSGNYALKSEIPSVPVQSVNGKTGVVQLTATDVKARPDNWMPTAQEVGALPNTYTPPNQTAEQVGADPKGTAASAVSQHNTNTDAHNDIRLELKAINDRLTAFFDSDDQALDELSEIVAYITSNKTLIESITTSKVSVADIINNLTTNVINKPLSAAQGLVLKGLLDELSGNLANYQPKGDYLASSELPAAINTALAQAKASGEFNGQPGKTPVRGTDYWTASDIAEIKSYVDTAILGGAW